MNKIDYRMCLAFRFKAFPMILSNSWNTHITYTIFKDIKKANKFFFVFLFSIHIKMKNNYYQKKKKESFEKKHVNDIKIFLKKKAKKPWERYQKVG